MKFNEKVRGTPNKNKNNISYKIIKTFINESAY